jgi:hypothetical protein
MEERKVKSALKKFRVFKEKKKVLPFYLKQGLPDQRFIDFRLFIHNRRPDEVQHDFKFFEPLMNPSNFKKRKSCRSQYREHVVYEQKKNRYLKQFTNGSVVLQSSKEDNALAKVKEQFPGLSQSKADRLTRLIEKAIKKKKDERETFTRPSTSLSPGRRHGNRTSTSFRQSFNVSAMQ